MIRTTLGTEHPTMAVLAIHTLILMAEGVNECCNDYDARARIFSTFTYIKHNVYSSVPLHKNDIRRVSKVNLLAQLYVHCGLIFQDKKKNSNIYFF